MATSNGTHVGTPDIVHGSLMHFQHPGLKHRAGSPLFKTLFTGTDADHLNNYNLVIAQQSSFYSPRHKHNFEQFRFPLNGSFSIGTDSVPEVVLHEGEFGYFPEGVEYGPQTDGAETKEILVLQFAGPCRQGYFSWEELKRIQASITAEDGTFEGGKFHEKGTGVVKDGFEALWERKMQKKLVYPVGRYREPVILNLEGFQWRSMSEKGAHRKLLGVFNEFGTAAELLKVEQGANMVVQGEAAMLKLFYVFKGSGKVNDETIEVESAFRLKAGGKVVLSSETSIEVLGMTLPLFE